MEKRLHCVLQLQLMQIHDVPLTTHQSVHHHPYHYVRLLRGPQNVNGTGSQVVVSVIFQVLVSSMISLIYGLLGLHEDKPLFFRFLLYLPVNKYGKFRFAVNLKAFQKLISVPELTP